MSRTLRGLALVGIVSLSCSDNGIQPALVDVPLVAQVPPSPVLSGGIFSIFVTSSTLTSPVPAGEAVFAPSVATLSGGSLAGHVVDGGFGCLPLAGVAGKIVLIERGGAFESCFLFTDKVLNAQSAGAIGVIMFNVVSNDDPFGMGGEPTSPVTIPAVGIGRTAGLTLRGAAPVNAVIAHDPYTGLSDGVSQLESVLDNVEVNSLTQTLANASRQASAGNTNAAVNMLRAFIQQVEALVASGRLAPEDGSLLISAAQQAITSLTP